MFNELPKETFVHRNLKYEIVEMRKIGKSTNMYHGKHGFDGVFSYIGKNMCSIRFLNNILQLRFYVICVVFPDVGSQNIFYRVVAWFGKHRFYIFSHGTY